MRNSEGLHTRPVMSFVDMASRYRCRVWVTNLSSRQGQSRVDGKSPMQMMLLEATRGSVLRIEGEGDDASEAVDALAKLVERGFDVGSCPQTI